MIKFIGLEEEKRKAKKFAMTDVPVLITGEPGVGKELMARYIHDESTRAGKEYGVVNCAAFNGSSLIESELFGHKKGSFTNACSDRAGRLDTVKGGTVFLDEIGDMSLGIQIKLLRFLESGEIQRVGEDRQISVDTRIVCATNHDIKDDMLNKKIIRPDFYDRIKNFEVHISPLRKRKKEIPLFVEYFFDFFTEKYKKNPGDFRNSIVESLISQAVEYYWPGNVRELKGSIERFVILEEEFIQGRKNEHSFVASEPAVSIPVVAPPVLVSTPIQPIVISAIKESEEGEVPFGKLTNNEEKKSRLKAALEKNAGNIYKTSIFLGVSLSKTHRLIKQIELADYAKELRKLKV